MKSALVLILIGVVAVGGFIVLLNVTLSTDVFNLSFGDQDTATQQSQDGDVLISTDQGITWTSALTNNNATSFIIKDVYYYAESGVTQLLAATNKGVYGSRNNGVDWSVAFGSELPQQPVFDLDVDFSANQANVFVVLLNNSNKSVVFRSQDGGRTFRQIYIAPTQEQRVVGVKIDTQNNNKVYMLLSNGYFFVSYDKGSSWEQYASISKSANVQFTDVLLYPRNASVLFATTKKQLYRSLDAGKSWYPVKTFTNTDIYSISISAVSEDIYVGTRNAILRSQDQGTTVTPVKFLTQQSQFPITAIFTDPQNTNALYIGSGNTLYKTTNKGSSWSVVNVFEGITGNINFFSINPYNSQLQYIGSNYYE